MSMKLVLSSTAVANTSHFPVGITDAIVSNDWGDDVVGCWCESIRQFDTLSDPLAKRNRGIMNTGSSKSLDSGAWRKLYTAVLFEVDKTKLPKRIAQAEKALALRARELFYAAGDSTAEEEQAPVEAIPSDGRAVDEVGRRSRGSRPAAAGSRHRSFSPPASGWLRARVGGRSRPG